ncbi:bromodomain testis-specific protein-like [Protopterus annectens]|uniref:bromodomain testis-specific protein-like n=1 Tax=Protopterus annectens TaxID=7888 RepID=UPI001CFAA29E|nr:bromodomain testis-specific protein-like [Protopterus annectens]
MPWPMVSDSVGAPAWSAHQLPFAPFTSSVALPATMEHDLDTGAIPVPGAGMKLEVKTFNQRSHDSKVHAKMPYLICSTLQESGLHTARSPDRGALEDFYLMSQDNEENLKHISASPLGFNSLVSPLRSSPSAQQNLQNMEQEPLHSNKEKQIVKSTSIIPVFHVHCKEEEEEHIDSKCLEPQHGPGPYHPDTVVQNTCEVAQLLDESLEICRKTDSALALDTALLFGTKKDIKVKNVDSWVSLAKKSTAVPSTTKSANDSFQLFRKAAIEKEEREKALRAQEQKQLQKEKNMNPDARKKENENALELNQMTKEEIAQRQEKLENEKKQQETESSTPLSNDQERQLARKREQERRRREAFSGTIDMTMQSDIMSAFEENL